MHILRLYHFFLDGALTERADFQEKFLRLVRASSSIFHSDWKCSRLETGSLLNNALIIHLNQQQFI